MSKSIEVNYVKLEYGINRLKNLKKKLEKPQMSNKSSLIKVGGQGDVKDSLADFTSTTRAYYKAVDNLLNNTILYLKNAEQTLKNADETIAKNISEEG